MTATNIGKAAPATSAPVEEGCCVSAASPASCHGPEHVTEPTEYDAILLAGFGGPEGQDDVIPFLRNVTGGRGIPDERLEEVAHHYRHFGGISPINEQNRTLKKALEKELAARGIDLPVYWGNRNWDPYIADAVVDAHRAGHDRLIAIATSAYSSYSSCRQYREDFADALEAAELQGVVTIDKIRQFFDHPGFIAPFVDSVVEHSRSMLADGVKPSRLRLLFATHSIPTVDAAKSGPESRGFGEHGAYEAQHLAVAKRVAESAVERLQAEGVLDGALDWNLVYQSRSGPPSMPWLEPDINDFIDEIHDDIDAIVIVPIGFVSDHMEVLWDLDNEAMETAEKHGIRAARAATPGSSEAYVRGLVDLVVERMHAVPVEDRPAETPLGPWYDVCRPGCCENTRRGFRPAVAGIAP